MLLITHQRTLISFLFTASVVHQPSRKVMPLFDPILSEEKDWRENTDVFGRSFVLSDELALLV